jgi:hypothetical protein
MISVGKKPDGSNKDARVSIEAHGHFVVQISHRDQVRALSGRAAAAVSRRSGL